MQGEATKDNACSCYTALRREADDGLADTTCTLRTDSLNRQQLGVVSIGMGSHVARANAARAKVD